MLKFALIALVISIVAGALGFTGISQTAGRVAKVLFFIFIAIFLALLGIAFLAGEAILGN